MIEKTRGIVLNFIKYGDSSIICKIYTESFGLNSYIINGVRKSKSKNIGLFQPLSVLDLVVYNKKNSKLQRIKEIKPDVIYFSLHKDIRKISVCYFISEFLSKVLNSEDDSKETFNFIYRSLVTFDGINEGFYNFHILFLLKLSKHFGIGIFAPAQLSEIDLGRDLFFYIENCIKNSYEVKISSNNKLRNKVINLLIEFYSRNLDINIKLKSTEVLREIFIENEV